MFCSKCGHENANQAVTCSSCGTSLRTVPTHLVWAVLATVLCCLPTGIVAIVYAAQVNSKLEAGNIEGARAASDNARMWSWISLALGLVSIFIYFIAILPAML